MARTRRATAQPARGGTSTAFLLTWASGAPPAGYVFDVQVRRPGQATFIAWSTGTSLASQTFTADAGPGSYAFRARLRNVSNGSAARYSVPRRIAVQ